MSDDYAEKAARDLPPHPENAMVVRTVVLHELRDGNVSIGAENTTPLQVEKILTQALGHITREINCQKTAQYVVQLIQETPRPIQRPGPGMRL